LAARSIWSGSISFGLVNIPVKIYTATDSKCISFNQIDTKGHKIQHKRWCPVEEKEIPYEEIRKGYPIKRGNYILLEKEDLEKIKIKTTDTIDIKEFIKAEDFDPIFIENTYYLAPAEKNNRKNNNNGNKSAPSKAYSLFVNVLNETKTIAIGKVVLREREHLVAIRGYQRGLVMHQMKYLDEIKPMDEIGGLSPSFSHQNSQEGQGQVDDKEMSLGRALVQNLTSEDFDPTKYSDSYAKELEKIIEAKSKGQKVEEIHGDEKEDTKDLLEALKASLKTSASNSNKSSKRSGK
jgi:DNA end-binding protein Ku